MINTNQVTVAIHETYAEAPKYVEEGNFTMAEITKAVIVRNGTEKGNSTIDIQFTDVEGNKYVAMVTAKLLKTITNLCVTEK